MRIALSTLTARRHVSINEEMEIQVARELLDVTPTKPLAISLSAELVEDKLFVHIDVAGEINARCDLCGEECLAPLACSMDEELAVTDPCFDPEDESFDLDELVEETVVMSLPRTVRCKADCKGLCPHCGRNRNYEVCDCEQSESTGSNNPFAQLQSLFSTGGAKNGSTKM